MNKEKKVITNAAEDLEGNAYTSKVIIRFGYIET